MGEPWSQAEGRGHGDGHPLVPPALPDATHPAVLTCRRSTWGCRSRAGHWQGGRRGLLRKPGACGPGRSSSPPGCTGTCWGRAPRPHAGGTPPPPPSPAPSAGTTACHGTRTPAGVTGSLCQPGPAPHAGLTPWQPRLQPRAAARPGCPCPCHWAAGAVPSPPWLTAACEHQTTFGEEDLVVMESPGNAQTFPPGMVPALLHLCTRGKGRAGGPSPPWGSR